jgi:hypothetical protein
MPEIRCRTSGSGCTWSEIPTLDNSTLDKPTDVFDRDAEWADLTDFALSRLPGVADRRGLRQAQAGQVVPAVPAHRPGRRALSPGHRAGRAGLADSGVLQVARRRMPPARQRANRPGPAPGPDLALFLPAHRAVHVRPGAAGHCRCPPGPVHRGVSRPRRQPAARGLARHGTSCLPPPATGHRATTPAWSRSACPRPAASSGWPPRR